MNDNSNAFWDELGFAWRVAQPEPELIAPRLTERLRRQSALIGLGIAGGWVLAIAGVALGAFTLWSGWTTGTWNFVSRGIAILAISALVALAVASAWPIRASDTARSLSAMLELAVARLARTLEIVRLGLAACAVAAVLGLVGTAIRTHFSGPPQMSPVIDVALLAAVAAGLALYRRHLRAELSRFRYLQQALSGE